LTQPHPEAVAHPDVEIRGRTERLTVYKFR